MKKCFLAVLTVFMLMGLKAQTNVLTVDSCLALAKENNADLKISHLDVLKAQEVKAQVFTKYFPQVSGSFIGYAAVEPILRFGVEVVSNETLRLLLQEIVKTFEPATGFNGEFRFLQQGVSAAAVIGQPVYMGGRIVNGNKLAEVGIEAAELKEKVTEREMIENVESSYYLVLGLQRKLKTLNTALTLLDTLEHSVAIALETGLVTNNDAMKVNLERNKLMAQKIQLENGIHLTSRLLCQQIGIELPADGISLVFDRDKVTDKFPTDTCFVRPEVRLLEIQVQAEKLRKKLTLGESLPSVVIGGMGVYGNIINTNFRGNFIAFARISIPMTQWWETSHKLKEHNIKIDQYEIERQNLTEKMSIQEEQAYTKMIEAEYLLVSDSTSYNLAWENFRVEKINYLSGLNTISDVLQANIILLQADNAITDRNITLIAAKRKYHDLTGK